MKEDKRNEIESLKNGNNSNVTAKEMQLRLAQGKVNKMRKEIAWMKQQINNAYEVDKYIFST